MKRTSLTYEEINQAGPEKILTIFEQLEKEIEAGEVQQQSAIYDVLLEEIDLLRDEYQRATIQRENLEAIIVAE